MSGRWNRHRFWLLKMQFKQSFNWFLLSFLVLLLNFGPSLHRAHFFGLHTHPADDQTCSHSSCCLGHDHSTEVPGIQSEAMDSHHDCAFCKFFDQYHVVSLQILYMQEVNPAVLNGCLEPSVVLAGRLNPSARGPPTLS
jgi:hypothetical protein